MLFRKLKYQLLFAFTILTVLTAISLIVSVVIYNKKTKITNVIRDIDNIRVLALKNFKLMDDYLTFETKNEAYFNTGKSTIKAEFEKNYFEILYQLEIKKENLGTGYTEVTMVIDSIVNQQKDYYRNFNDLEVLILQKGFKDYGVEGRMRDFAHQLMNLKNADLQNSVLMMRRHEKDYIIRRETEYFLKFNNSADELVRRINNVSKSEDERKISVDLVLNYKKYFTDYYNLQCQIGASEKEGLLHLLNANYKNIDLLFNKEKQMTSEIELDLSNTLKYYFLIFLISSLLISLLFGYIYSNRISNSVSGFKQVINNYVMSGFKERPALNNKNRILEFELIGNNFQKMADEIDSYINFFKSKVEERTAEIRLQKDEIESQKAQIQIQNETLIKQQNDLMQQKQLLSDKNQSFTDSINYAQRIQHALLPTTKHFKKCFADSFIFYQPRDIVSGDFYWLEVVESTKKVEKVMELEFFGGIELKEYIKEEYSSKLQNEEKENKVMFAVADCTGHGVPGAFMSIVGINNLNKLVKENKIYDPADLLNQLNYELKVTLRQDYEDSISLKDGMDIACCVYDEKREMLQFAGANKKLYLLREGHLHEFKGSNRSLGLNFYGYVEDPYSRIDIKVQKGDRVYLFSDGYQDQFGGEKNKKFKTKNLKQLLIKISEFPMHDQLEIIKENFENWKGDNFQVDDVLMIGVQI